MAELDDRKVLKLKDDELDEICGGICYEESKNDVRWHYKVGERVECYYTGLTIIGLMIRSHGGIVTALDYAYKQGKGYCDIYYINMDDTEYSGWYPREFINNDSTPATGDYKGGYFY